MKITSPAFENNSTIPSKYTCNGEGVNPPMSFSDVPEATKSLVLIMDDPDAPNGTFTHWILFNIDPKISEIKENSIPQSALQGKTSMGAENYVAACPPPASPEQLQRGESGIHRYHFKLFALDTILDLTNPDKTGLEAKMQGHIIDEIELIGLYGRH
jgi:Raf kinase inhibitor-like YbhB/YbcL family protein